MSAREPRSAAAFSQPTGVLITLAAAGVAAWAVAAARGVLAPLLLAAILIIVIHPVRRGLDRRGLPPWAGTTAVILVAYSVLVGLGLIVGLAFAQFGHVLDHYAQQLHESSQQVVHFFAGIGWDASTLRPDVLLPVLGSAARELLSSGVALFFVFAYLLFLAVDAARFRSFPATLALAETARVSSFREFADATSRYYAVNSIFGAIVAVIDGLALWALNVPAPFAWAVLAFVTNYIPNIGFVIGLVPPVVLAVLTGGWGLGVLVLVIYCLVNLVLQEFVQPRFVATTVRLSITLTFFSVVLWSVVLGPVGSLIAVPLSLFIRFLVLGAEPRGTLARWLSGDERPPEAPSRSISPHTPE